MSGKSGHIEDDGTRVVLVETKLPPAVPWTNDILDKVRESIRPYAPAMPEPGLVNWKMVLAGIGIGTVALAMIFMTRKRG